MRVPYLSNPTVFIDNFLVERKLSISSGCFDINAVIIYLKRPIISIISVIKEGVKLELII
jgi:hypothetical protein